MKVLSVPLVALLCVPLTAQTPSTPKSSSPIDLTGYWVSLVSEDWRYRMLAAPKGDYYGIPLNAEGHDAAPTARHFHSTARGARWRGGGFFPGHVHRDVWGLVHFSATATIRSR